MEASVSIARQKAEPKMVVPLVVQMLRHNFSSVATLVDKSKPYSILYHIMDSKWANETKLRPNKFPDREKYIESISGNITLLKYANSLSNEVARDARVCIRKLEKPYEKKNIDECARRFETISQKAVPLLDEKQAKLMSDTKKNFSLDLSSQKEHGLKSQANYKKYFENLLKALIQNQAYYKDAIEMEISRVVVVFRN